MKKILLILALLCVSLQAQVYNFESAATGSSGISTATARQNTGWTSNGTTAQDTLATIYRLDGKANIRFIVTDTDGDTLWFYPQNLHPFMLKDGSTILAAIDSSGRAGFGTSTSGQARRAILNVLATQASDTLLAVIGDRNGHVAGFPSTADSAFYVLADGSITGRTAGVAGNFVRVSGGILIGSATYESTGLSDYSFGGFIRFSGSSGAINIGSANSNVIRLTPASQVIVGATSTKSAQAFLTVNANGTADTTFMIRNDKNSTLDSTMMVFANGDGYFGGNNLYQGGHRWRSNAAGDSLILYDGNTMIMAFLSDGTIADLVAGTPPTLWRNGPPQEYIWLLRLGVLLLLLLVAFKVYDYAKPRIRKHQTLPGEI